MAIFQNFHKSLCFAVTMTGGTQVGNIGRIVSGGGCHCTIKVGKLSGPDDFGGQHSLDVNSLESLQ